MVYINKDIWHGVTYFISNLGLVAFTIRAAKNGNLFQPYERIKETSMVVLASYDFAALVFYAFVCHLSVLSSRGGVENLVPKSGGDDGRRHHSRLWRQDEQDGVGRDFERGQGMNSKIIDWEVEYLDKELTTSREYGRFWYAACARHLKVRLWTINRANLWCKGKSPYRLRPRGTSPHCQPRRRISENVTCCLLRWEQELTGDDEMTERIDFRAWKLNLYLLSLGVFPPVTGFFKVWESNI